jgi:membrane-bound serine protease (ClpP class)
MKSRLVGLFFLAYSSLAFAEISPVYVLNISDSINPGTCDYIVSGIDAAEAKASPYIILQLDTPGGLLTSTRQIVQKMLNSKIPVVVFIGPRGAHAGSAGALITFAADVAAMAPGTHLGSAHPVGAGGEKIDGVMAEKITNDTAAFAESLARHNGRNTQWAIQSVRKSESLIAEEALKIHVVDLMAEDLKDLTTKLANYKLAHPKGAVTYLGPVVTTTTLAPNIKQTLVSFFSDPTLAYLILTFGGLCLWIEMSHPGLILPGILGAICILTSLISFQMLPIHYGALGLILLGMGCLVAELFLPTYGVLGIGGIVSFIFGSLFLMDTNVPEFQISLSLIFPTAAVLATAILILAYLLYTARKTQLRSGLNALVGELGEIKEPVSSSSKGMVLIHGELWNAISDSDETIPGGIVVVTEVQNMLLKVRPHSQKK